MTNNNRLVIAAIALVVVLYVLFSSVYIVNPRQQAIVTRFGKITQVHTTPGLYFKLPTSIVDNVQIIENRLLRYDIANMTLQVKGGKFYLVDAFLTYRISDPRKFREKALGSLDIVEARIGTRFDSALRQVYGLREFSAALSAERTEMMTQARDLIRPDMADLGIDIVDVRILRTDLTQQVSAQTYARMKSERLAAAALLRANGNQAAQSLKAIADRQAVEIRADAKKDADILRGQGEGERSSIYANAYNVDPEFFEFYRSMEAYRTALGPKGTSMVLSPDSEFFRYFGSNSTVNTGISTPAAPNPLGLVTGGAATTGPLKPGAAPITVPEDNKPDPALDNSPTPSPTGTAPPIPSTDASDLAIPIVPGKGISTPVPNKSGGATPAPVNTTPASPPPAQ